MSQKTKIYVKTANGKMVGLEAVENVQIGTASEDTKAPNWGGNASFSAEIEMTEESRELFGKMSEEFETIYNLTKAIAEYAVEQATKNGVDFTYMASIMANASVSICYSLVGNEKDEDVYEKAKAHFLELFDDCFSNLSKYYSESKE